MLALLITEAFAQRVGNAPTPPPVPYGDFPIVQAAFALLILIAGGVMAFKAALREKPPEEKPRQPSTYVYADGAVADLLVQVKVIADALKVFPASVATAVSLKEQFAADLKETRHSIRNEMQEKMQEIDRDFEKRDREREDSERRMREVSDRVARLEGQLQQRGH